MFLSPTKRARFDPTENSFGGDPILRRFAGTPTEGLFRASHLNESVSQCKASAGVIEYDEHSFEDGITRRSAKLAPWANFRPRLQVAARKVSAEQRRKLK